MRIAYFFHWNEGITGTTYRGVLNKIVGQINAWQKSHHEAKLFILTVHGGVLTKSDLGLGQISISVCTYQSRIDQLKQAPRLIAEIESWQPNVVYCRYTGFIPPLRRMMRHFPTILEINSDILSETVTVYGRGIRYWYHRMTQLCWLKNLSGIVFLSEELSKGPQHSRFRKPSIVIANGVDLDLYSEMPPPNNLAPRLVFIGSAAPWQGVDKVVQLAHQCPGWQFDLIGPFSEDLKSQMPQNVILHGFLLKDQYEAIFRDVDVALGSLALYRKQMSEASPLKVREYLAYGIPTIIGYCDTDFPEAAPFLLQLSNTEENIIQSLDDIIRFVEKWKGKRISRKEIALLDAKFKEERRLEFFQQIVHPR